MSRLSTHKEDSYIKFLLLGESKTGKTGALASLVHAGYKLLIIDFDAGLDYLAAQVAKDDPALLDNVYFETFGDKTKLTSTRDVVVEGRPHAFADAFKALDDGIEDSGPPKDLGHDWVVVIDSLWAAGRAAFFAAGVRSLSFTPKKGSELAQGMIMAMLENLTDPDFHANVCVISHMTLMELDNGVTKGLPAAIGKAVCSNIPKLFNRMLVMEIKGAGRTAKRVISTVPTTLITATSGELKDKVPATLPIETGLADFFKIVTGDKK